MDEKGNPKVTVLMSVYNGDRYLNEAIDCILAQTYTDFEFLIIDDGSTDKTPEILRSYDDPKIRIVTNEENLGLTKSLNKGFSFARGEYIARMDADDISLPDRLEKEVIYLDCNPKVILVGTGRENIDENGITIDYFIPPKNVSANALQKKNQFQHSSVMFRKDIIMNEGGYCNLFECCQDYYLWLKLTKKYSLHNIPDILCKLRVQKNSVSNIKVHKSALSHIFARRIFNELMNEGDICYDHDSINFTKEEKIFYLNRLAENYRINENYKEARKKYLEIFYLNPLKIIPLINFVRLLLGKWAIEKTSKLYITLKK